MASTIELWHAGRCVARHETSLQRQQQILGLKHYLDVLYRKPGALAGGSEPLEQRRQAGLWPPSFEQIWKRLIERHGNQSGTRQMIDLLKLAQKHGQQKLQQVVELCLSSSLVGFCGEALAVGALDRYVLLCR